MKFGGTAAVPAALALLCVASPALAQTGPAAGHSSPAKHNGFYALLDAMAAGAGKIPSPAPAATAKTTAPASHATARQGRHHRHHRAARRETEHQHSHAVTAKPAAGHGDLHALVVSYARKEGIPPALAHSVVMVESRYRPHATGHGGYIGLMQLSYRTARGMGYRGTRAGLYDPETNIRYGVHYLAEAYRQAGGNLCATVSKYQGGTGVRGVTRAGAVYCGRVRHYMAEVAGTRTADNTGS